MLTLQIVAINKVDIPRVSANLDETKTKIRKNMGHSRIIEISAATGENVKELMLRTYNFIQKLS